MRVMRNCYGWIAAVILSGSLSAQVVLGEPAPTATFARWLQGEPIAASGDQAPKAVVYAFYGDAASGRWFAGDGGYLADLQRRHGERGLVVVGVVGDAATPGGERWVGCRLALDEGAAVAIAWQLAPAPSANLVLLDAAGRVAFVGTAGAGLCDAIESVLSGRREPGRDRQVADLRLELPAGFDDLTAAAAEHLLPAVAHAPADGLLQGLLYLVQATKASDLVAALATARAAVTRMAGESRPLAVFADLALRGDPRRPELCQLLREPLQAAAQAQPHDPVVQLALLRVLVQLGLDREVGRVAMRSRKLVTVVPDHALDFASLLTLDGNAAAHRDLATLAVDAAERLQAMPRLVTAARYGIAVRCAQDRDAQKQLLDEYLKDTDMRVSINNDCWYLMTELGTMGRFDVFAAGLAERMLEQREGMDYFEFDTAALAMFLAGRGDEAIELQQEAIKKGGNGNPEYTERLARYQQAKAPAPR
jgi:hypothetical protein